MKQIITAFLILIIVAAKSTAQSTSDSLFLTNDMRWQSEILEFPLSFAPEMGLEGYEDLRFLKGWRDPDSDEFWSYGFAWVLDKNPRMTAKKLSEKASNYFDGLMGLSANDAEEENAVSGLVRKTTSRISRIKDSPNMYAGTIETVDAFFTKEPLKFNVRIETSYCKILQKHVVLFHLSPNEFEEKVWEQLEMIKAECK